MLRVDKEGKRLIPLTKSALADAAHWERQLQSMIVENPNAFCEELGESLWIIGQEVKPSDSVADRMDILAVDEAGTAVVMELKRGSHKLQMLQAISYAGMLTRWSADQFVSTLAQNYQQTQEDARADIENHTGSDISTINSAQRVLLIAEDFDPALLVAAEWLHENYGVDIRCYRIQLSREGANEYLTCTCSYPPIEIAALTRHGDRARTPRDVEWSDWDGALAPLSNAAERNFFKVELGLGQECRLRYRELVYRLKDKRRFWVACRLEHAYVRQRGRFDGDEAYWAAKLSKPDTIGTRHEGRSLRFSLYTAGDFQAFKDAVKSDMPKMTFSEVPENDGAGDD